MSEHTYLSTACLHEQHGNCRVRCKFCNILCFCDCHTKIEREAKKPLTYAELEAENQRLQAELKERMASLKISMDQNGTLGAEILTVRLELQAAKLTHEQLQSDLDDYERACWHCLHPDSGDPEQHEHGSGPHWHHYIDPGDGLPSPCKNSDMLNRVTAQLKAEHERYREWAAGQMEQLKLALEIAQEQLHDYTD